MMSLPNSFTLIEAPEQDLTFRELLLLYETGGLSLSRDTYRKNLHLLTPDGKYNLMAYVLSDHNSISMKAAEFSGTDKLKLLRRNEFGFHCMLTAADQIVDYLQTVNETVVEMNGLRRKDHRRFDPACFREAWMNACMHSRWDRMTPPAVYIYSDRIEVVSVGGLPYGLSEEEFFTGHSRPVNLELQQIMLQLGFVEQTGHGVPLIVQRYGREAFDISDNYITVTIPFDREAGQQETAIPVVRRPDRKEAILEIIAGRPDITVHELAEKLGVGVSTMMKEISSLKATGRLTREGSKKKGVWRVVE